MHSSRDLRKVIDELIDGAVNKRLKEHHNPVIPNFTMRDGSKVNVRDATPEQWEAYTQEVWEPTKEEVVNLLEELVKFRVTRLICDQKS